MRPRVFYKEISDSDTRGRETFVVIESESKFWPVGETFSDDDMSMGSRQVEFHEVD